MNSILRYWWLILLAWLLAIVGEDFWTFNIMEVFATIAILVTAGIAIWKWRKEKKRQNTLMDFPDNWTAKYNGNKEVVDFQMNADVLITFHAYSFDADISASGKRLYPQNVEDGQPMINKKGQIFLTGEIPISEIPKGVTELEVKANITLDGKVKKSSGKRKLFITDMNLLAPDKEGSQN